MHSTTYGGMALARKGRMQVLKLVRRDEEHEVYEQDISCAEPAAEERATVRVGYEGVNAFLGQYLAKARRGQPVIVALPPEVTSGDLIDLEIAIEGLDTFVLHAQVLSRWPAASSELAE